MMSNFSKLWEFFAENEIDPLVVALIIRIVLGDNSEN